jgi:proline dehydrogenase
MLRALLLYLSDAGWAQRLVMNWRIARKAASRFVAGDSLPEAMTVVQELNGRGLYVTLDHLGEYVTEQEEARKAAADYLELIDSIAQKDVAAGISLKLTQLGLALDFDFCFENILLIVQQAAGKRVFVRIDMEDSSTVDDTLRIFRLLRNEDVRNVGLVFQAYLYRTVEDVEALLDGGCPIRLCKGAYNEPADVAYPKKADVDGNFDRIAALLIDRAVEQEAGVIGDKAGRFPSQVAIGTHDENRIEFARQYARHKGLLKEALEFQMLYGIRPELQLNLAAAGYPVRVYVPYGMEWYPYFMRRLAERPANVWFFLSNLLKA